jgi:hypothetical protein
MFGTNAMGNMMRRPIRIVRIQAPKHRDASNRARPPICSPGRLGRHIVGRAAIADDPENPSVDLDVMRAKQRLEGAAVALDEPSEHAAIQPVGHLAYRALLAL